jgi:hypothetical protein
MSARLLIDAVCDLSLPPASATDDEIRALLDDSDLNDWYDYADCIWSANAIAESLLATHRNLKRGGRPVSAETSSAATQLVEDRDWWAILEDTLDRHFTYWAVTVFFAGVVAGVLQ